MKLNFFGMNSPEKARASKTEVAKAERVEVSDAEKAEKLCETLIESYERKNEKELPSVVKQGVENSLVNMFAKGLLRPDSINDVEKFVNDKIEAIERRSLEKTNQKPVGRDEGGQVFEESQNKTSLMGKAEYGE